MTPPPWSKDDRPGIKVFAKVCPDCAIYDAAANDPRHGLRPTSAFGRNIRSDDGLQDHCRHHAQQRRKRLDLTPAPDQPGPLSAAAARALQATPAGNGHSPPALALSAQETEALLGSVAELALRLQALEVAHAPGAAAAPSAGDELHPAFMRLEERVAGLEAVATTPQAPTEELHKRLEALAARLATVESVQNEERAVPGPDAHEPANTRNLRRWIKQIGKETQAQSTRIERVEAKVGEAVRLAQAAGRINAGRATPPAPEANALKQQLLVALQPLLLDALEARLAEIARPATSEAPSADALPALISQIVDERLSVLTFWPTKENAMSQVATPPATAVDHGSPEGLNPDIVRRTVEGILLRFAAGLRNVSQIERDGLLEADDIALITERISQRSAAELCTYITRLCAQSRKDR